MASIFGLGLTLIAGLLADQAGLRSSAAELAGYDKAEAAIGRTPEEEKACVSVLTNVRYLRQQGIAPGDNDFALRPFRDCISQHRQAEKRLADSNERKKVQLAEITAKHEETDRKAAAAAALAQVSREAAKDPKVARYILSAALCRDLADRSALLSELAQDKKYSRIGGAINLSRRADIQDQLADVDASALQARAALRQWKASPMPCKEHSVVVMTSCLSEDPDAHDEECGSPNFQVLTMAARMVIP